MKDLNKKFLTVKHTVESMACNCAASCSCPTRCQCTDITNAAALDHNVLKSGMFNNNNTQNSQSNSVWG